MAQLAQRISMLLHLSGFVYTAAHFAGKISSTLALPQEQARHSVLTS